MYRNAWNYNYAVMRGMSRINQLGKVKEETAKTDKWLSKCYNIAAYHDTAAVNNYTTIATVECTVSIHP